MAPIINPQLIERQPPDDGHPFPAAYTQLMVEKQSDFGSRFEELRGDMSYNDLSAAILERFGARITAQAMHKWVKQGGGITPENARIVADYFGVNPGWLLFGEGPAPEPRIRHILEDLPPEHSQQSLDFIEYQLSRAGKFIAAEKMASYMTMIESIRQDLAKRKGGK